MNTQAELETLAKQLRNKKAQEWRNKNKLKVKEINKRYWLKKAKEELEKKESGKNEQ